MKIISNIVAIIIIVAIIFKLKNFINGKKTRLEANIKNGITKNIYPSLNKKLYILFSDFIKKNVC